MDHQEGGGGGAVTSLKAAQDEEYDNVLYVNFNQDFTSLSLGCERSYKIYDFIKNDEMTCLCTNAYNRCVVVQRLYSSSLVAVVGGDHPRRLSVNHFKKNSHICNYTYTQSILSVLLNRERLVVCCEDRLSIHVVKDMELIHIITDTPTNTSGLCALANSTTNCFLAYPASTTTGTVQIFDAYNLVSVVTISAHESPLQCFSFNDHGTKLATASLKGTVIRVFDVPSSSKLCELRRGLSRCATISSLTFSADAHFLLCSSNTPTIHVFKLSTSDSTTTTTTTTTSTTSTASTAASTASTPAEVSYVSSFYSMLGSAVSASAAYLPAPVAGLMNQERAFAWATLPSQGKVTKAALPYLHKTPRVVVATNDGMVYIYDFNIVAGGECKLVKQHNLNSRPCPEEDRLQEALDDPLGALTLTGGGPDVDRSSPPPDATAPFHARDPQHFTPLGDPAGGDQGSFQPFQPL